ncbi:MAG: hypothetical protein ACREQQ_10745 [Candidatus Binatia bacterium]
MRDESRATRPRAGAQPFRTTTEPLLFKPVIGTADDVARGLDDFLRSTRTTHLVLGMHLPGIDPMLSRRCGITAREFFR